MTAKLADPVGLIRVAALLAPALRRTKKALAATNGERQEDGDGTADPHRPRE
jgi:hypothetical protein